MYSFNSSDSVRSCWNENGANGQPPNSANLEKDSTQAKRSARDASWSACVS